MAFCGGDWGCFCRWASEPCDLVYDPWIEVSDGNGIRVCEFVEEEEEEEENKSPVLGEMQAHFDIGTQPLNFCCLLNHNLWFIFSFPCLFLFFFSF